MEEFDKYPLSLPRSLKQWVEEFAANRGCSQKEAFIHLIRLGQFCHQKEVFYRDQLGEGKPEFIRIMFF